MKKIKTYCLYLKSRCEIPDFEDMVKAKSHEEALEAFKLKNNWLTFYDNDLLREHIGIIPDSY